MFLCTEQFKTIEYNDFRSDMYNFKEVLSEVKKTDKEYYVTLFDDLPKAKLHDYIDTRFITEFEKKNSLSKEEEQKLILSKIKLEFNNLPNIAILSIAEEYCKNSTYISKIKYLYLFITSTQNELEKISI